MSWGRFPGFDDPFFTSHGHHSHGFPSFPVLGFPSPSQQQFQRSDQQLSMLADPFSMFNNMERMMNSQNGHQGGHSYSSSSSVMHFSSSGNGQPKVYHSTSSVVQGPGGVKETRKTESNSETGIKKMAIGHHINDRAHLVEKRHDTKSGNREQHQELINLDETDAAGFNQEWQEKTRSFRNPRARDTIKSNDRDHFADSRGLGCSSDADRCGGTSGDRRGFADRRGQGAGGPLGADRRGGNGLPDIRTESNNMYRRDRSRSPEKKASRVPNLDPMTNSSASAARRNEYVKEDTRHNRKVRF